MKYTESPQKRKFGIIRFLLINISVISIVLFIISLTKLLEVNILISQSSLASIAIIPILVSLYFKYLPPNKSERKNIEEIIKYTLIILISTLIILIGRVNPLARLARQNSLIFYALFFFTISLTIRHIINYNSLKINLKYLLRSKYTYILILLFIIGFLIRHHNLTVTDLQIDEYNHLRHAITLRNTGRINYTRSFFLTHVISILYGISENSSLTDYMYWARLPSVIIGSLSIIPIYFLAKDPYKWVGIIVAILWTISPWAISLSRMSRGYIFYLTIIVISTTLTYYVLEKLLNYKRKNLLKILFASFTIFLSVYYALIVDSLSTMKVILPILSAGYFVFLVINIKEIFNKITKKQNLLLILVISHSLAFLFLWGYFARTRHADISSLEPNWVWLTYFYNPNPSFHWWSNFIPAYTPIILTFIGAIGAYTKKDKRFFFFFGTFLLTSLSYVLFFNRYTRDRYIFYIYPFFVVLIAYGIYYLFYFRNYFNKNKILKYLYTALAIIFLLLSFNIKNTFESVSEKEHYYFQEILAFLEDKVDEDDVFISYFRHGFRIEFGNSVYRYNYKDPDMEEKVEEIVRQNPQGFLVLTYSGVEDWNSRYPLTETFLIGDTSVETLKVDELYIIYRWKR
jgi:hypothetical protein